MEDEKKKLELQKKKLENFKLFAEGLNIFIKDIGLFITVVSAIITFLVNIGLVSFRVFKHQQMKMDIATIGGKDLEAYSSKVMEAIVLSNFDIFRTENFSLSGATFILICIAIFLFYKKRKKNVEKNKTAVS